MDVRAITGYIALALIAGYWVWVLSCTTPELRRGTRDRELRLKILLVKTAALVLTTLVVGIVHFWATHVWQVLVAVLIAAAVGYALRRVYRRLVAAPRHRLPLGHRIRHAGHLQVIFPPGGVRHPAHRVTTVVPAPRPAAEPILPLIAQPIPAALTPDKPSTSPNVAEQASAT